MPLPSRRSSNNNGGSGASARVLTAVVIVALFLVSYLTFFDHYFYDSSSSILSYNSLLADVGGGSATSRSMASSSALLPLQQAHDPLINPLGIPPGEAQALPSVRIAEHAVDRERKYYGGAGDQKHLGGFVELDVQGLSPAVWRTMLQQWGVRSVLDVGCGRGISTSWFALHGCRVQCVEGSHDAVEQSIIEEVVPGSVAEHDFSRGPWWPEQTFDAAWAVEFLEHVGVNYHYNYVTAFRKAALLFVTSSRWGGWHHVEVHFDDWWIRKYESYGFRYDKELTGKVRYIAQLEINRNNETAPNGEPYNAQHIWLSMKVFVNPVVASLPQHAHLFPEHGCFGGKDKRTQQIIHRLCGTGAEGALESALPAEYFPLQPTKEQDKAWSDLIRQHITLPKEEEKK